mgnify:CR=1 FL=1
MEEIAENWLKTYADNKDPEKVYFSAGTDSPLSYSQTLEHMALEHL